MNWHLLASGPAPGLGTPGGVHLNSAVVTGLIVGIPSTIIAVAASAGFLVTRIVTWERIRRHRYHGHLMLPADLLIRIAELEAELEACRSQAAP